MYGPWGPGFVVIIVLAGCATVILKHYFRAQAKGMGRQDEMVGKAEFEACKAKMDEMEERMRVLERIVTSKRDRLARELSELED